MFYDVCGQSKKMLNGLHFEMMHAIFSTTLKKLEIVGCDEPLKQSTKFTLESMTG